MNFLYNKRLPDTKQKQKKLSK